MQSRPAGENHSFSAIPHAVDTTRDTGAKWYGRSHNLQSDRSTPQPIHVFSHAGCVGLPPFSCTHISASPEKRLPHTSASKRSRSFCCTGLIFDIALSFPIITKYMPFKGARLFISILCFLKILLFRDAACALNGYRKSSFALSPSICR